MKKYFYPIFLVLVLLGLILKRFAIPGAGLVLIISAGVLSIGFAVKGFKSVGSNALSGEMKTFVASTSLYSSFTLIGLLFRHQWWPFPFYDIIFWSLWPLATITIIVLTVRFYRTLRVDMEISQRKKLTVDLLIPFYIVTLLSIPTFLVSTDWFCKVYKPYTAEEIESRWAEEEK